MKVTIEFNLPEEEDDYKLAVNGRIFWSALWDIKQEIRAILKYGTEKDMDQVLEDLRSLIPHQVEEIS
jgi:hypothetical protein